MEAASEGASIGRHCPHQLSDPSICCQKLLCVFLVSDSSSQILQLFYSSPNRASENSCQLSIGTLTYPKNFRHNGAVTQFTSFIYKFNVNWPLTSNIYCFFLADAAGPIFGFNPRSLLLNICHIRFCHLALGSCTFGWILRSSICCNLAASLPSILCYKSTFDHVVITSPPLTLRQIIYYDEVGDILFKVKIIIVGWAGIGKGSGTYLRFFHFFVSSGVFLFSLSCFFRNSFFSSSFPFFPFSDLVISL